MTYEWTFSPHNWRPSCSGYFAHPQVRNVTLNVHRDNKEYILTENAVNPLVSLCLASHVYVTGWVEMG